MKYYIMFSIAAVCLLNLFSCAAPSSEINPESEINQLWTSFNSSWNKMDAKACADFYSDDAVNIPPGSTIKNGKQEIEAFYSGLFAANLSADYRHEVISIVGAGNIAIEQGQFKVDWTRKDSTTWTFNARTLTHWEKDEQGEWKIQAFMYNNPPQE